MYDDIFFYLALWVIQSVYGAWDWAKNWVFWTCSYLLNFLYHHHCSRDLIRRDTKKLKKKPKHIAVIIECVEDGGIEGLIHDACELSAWCVCSNIRELTIYERKGI